MVNDEGKSEALTSFSLYESSVGARSPSFQTAAQSSEWRGRIRGRAESAVLHLGIGLCLVVLAGCTLPLPQWGSTIDLEVMLPDTPPAWEPFGELPHHLVMPTAEGSSQQAASTVVEVPPGTGSVRVRIEKRVNYPLLLYPVLDGRTDLLKPAGAIYPADLEAQGRLPLSYGSGFLADLLRCVYRSRDILEALNVTRLRREIQERSGGDPWSLDRERILEGIVYGSMRSSRIRCRPSNSLSLCARAGEWTAGNPFIPPILVSEAPALLVLSGLPVGVHHFFLSPTGSRYDSSGQRTGATAPSRRGSDRIDLFVGEEGWRSLDVATGNAESGRW